MKCLTEDKTCKLFTSDQNMHVIYYHVKKCEGRVSYSTTLKLIKKVLKNTEFVELFGIMYLGNNHKNQDNNHNSQEPPVTTTTKNIFNHNNQEHAGCYHQNN